MTEKISIAVVGASDLVGEAFFAGLAQSPLPVGQVYVLDNQAEAIGETLMYGNHQLLIEVLDSFDFSQVSVVIFLANEAAAREYAVKAAQEEALVIDASGAFLAESGVPVVVAGVNDEDIPRQGIISVPSSAAMQLCHALAPIEQAVGIKQVNVTVCQGVATLGKPAVEELVQQTANLLNVKPIEPSVLPKQIAFNVIPQIGELAEAGWAKTEQALIADVRSVLNNATLAVYPHLVQVPVFYGEGITVSVETYSPLSLKDSISWWGNDTLLKVSRDSAPTPVSETADSEQILVGRIRQSVDNEMNINFWLVSDNIRCGIALNCIQITEKYYNN